MGRGVLKVVGLGGGRERGNRRDFPFLGVVGVFLRLLIQRENICSYSVGGEGKGKGTGWGF